MGFYEAKREKQKLSEERKRPELKKRTFLYYYEVKEKIKRCSILKSMKALQTMLKKSEKKRQRGKKRKEGERKSIFFIEKSTFLQSKHKTHLTRFVSVVRQRLFRVNPLHGYRKKRAPTDKVKYSRAHTDGHCAQQWMRCSLFDTQKVNVFPFWPLHSLHPKQS